MTYNVFGGTLNLAQSINLDSHTATAPFLIQLIAMCVMIRTHLTKNLVKNNHSSCQQLISTI